MLPYVIVGVLIGLPIVLGFVMRVSAPHLFFSVMAGDLLARYFGFNAAIEAEKAFRSDAITHYTELALLTIPVILTALILRNTVSRAKNIFNLIPLIITGLVYASFALPLLPADVKASVAGNPLGAELLNTSSNIIGVVVLVQLVSLWILNHSDVQKKHKRGKKG
jgi:hypothetical protein